MVSLRVYDCKKQAEQYLVYDEELRQRDGGADMAANQNGYSSHEILTMQQDAIRRVNEMQRLAREKVATSENHPQNNKMQAEHHSPQQEAEHHSPQQEKENKMQHPNHNKQNNQHHHEEKHEHQPVEKNEVIKIENCPTEVVHQGLTGFLDRLNLDPETLLLMGLIFLLVNEGADVMLLLALGYILL